MRQGNGSRARTAGASAKVAARSRPAAAEECIRLRPVEAPLAAAIASQRRGLATRFEDYLRRHADELTVDLLLTDCT